MHVYVPCFILSKPKGTYGSLTPQVEAVIAEVSTVQALRLRAYPRQFHGAKHLQLMNWTYGDTGFYSSQTTYLSMKVIVLHIFSLKIEVFLNYCWPELWPKC